MTSMLPRHALLAVALASALALAWVIGQSLPLPDRPAAPAAKRARPLKPRPSTPAPAPGKTYRYLTLPDTRTPPPEMLQSFRLRDVFYWRSIPYMYSGHIREDVFPLLRKILDAPPGRFEVCRLLEDILLRDREFLIENYLLVANRGEARRSASRDDVLAKYATAFHPEAPGPEKYRAMQLLIGSMDQPLERMVLPKLERMLLTDGIIERTEWREGLYDDELGRLVEKRNRTLANYHGALLKKKIAQTWPDRDPLRSVTPERIPVRIAMDVVVMGVQLDREDMREHYWIWVVGCAKKLGEASVADARTIRCRLVASRPGIAGVALKTDYRRGVVALLAVEGDPYAELAAAAAGAPPSVLAPLGEAARCYASFVPLLPARKFREALGKLETLQDILIRAEKAIPESGLAEQARERILRRLKELHALRNTLDRDLSEVNGFAADD